MDEVSHEGRNLGHSPGQPRLTNEIALLTPEHGDLSEGGGVDNDVCLVEPWSVGILNSDGENSTSMAPLGATAIFGEVALANANGRGAFALARSHTACPDIREPEFLQRLGNGAKLRHFGTYFGSQGT